MKKSLDQVWKKVCVCVCDAGTPQMTDRRNGNRRRHLDCDKSQTAFHIDEVQYVQVIHHEHKMLIVVGFIVETAGEKWERETHTHTHEV